MARVTIISTGGTIGNTENGRISIEQVLDDIQRWSPGFHPRMFADIEVREVLRRGAETFAPDDWVTIGRAVSEAAAETATDAVLVTHGTFTAEETAYFLHLAVPTAKPLVMACSQRKHGTVGNDGDKNLIDAVRVAATAESAGKGALVVLNEEIHSAREVTKTSRRPSGFRSNHSGILGTVDEDGVTFYRAPTRRHTADSELSIPDEPLPRVDVVATYAGADGAAVDAFLAAGAQGIVVNGFSYSGKPHENQRPALERAVAAGVPVVLVNRGGDGRMPAVDADGFIRGDDLTAQKARVLLSLALAKGRDTAWLQRVFSEY